MSGSCGMDRRLQNEPKSERWKIVQLCSSIYLADRDPHKTVKDLKDVLLPHQRGCNGGLSAGTEIYADFL